MSITVTQDIKEGHFPIRVEIDGHIDQKFTIKAAIELRRKLERAISDYQVDNQNRAAVGRPGPEALLAGVSIGDMVRITNHEDNAGREAGVRQIEATPRAALSHWPGKFLTT